MNQDSLSAIPITKADLQKALEKVAGLIKSVSWSIAPVVDDNDPSYYQKKLEKKEVSVSISELIHAIDPSDDLLSDEQLHLLRAIRCASQVAYHVSKDYMKRAGVPDKMPRGATQAQKTELNEKEQTASAIALFTMTRYILWDIQSLITDNAFLKNVNVQIDEVELSRVIPSLRCATFFFGRAIESESHNDDARLIATVYRYVELLQQEILNRCGALKYVEYFSDVTYQLEESDFAISGFALVDLAGALSVEFNRLNFNQIVGNRDAKHFMRMDAMRRACYDLQEQKNPFLELGGITPVFMGYGIPGTGKSMAIAAYATLLSDLCAIAGIPFLFHPLPDNLIDSFQGNSAKNMINWMKPIQDPSRIVWAPIDDAESILENRLNQGVSEGVKAVIGVFLRYTEGAYAINRGNSAIGVFTNLPEKIDSAIISRIQARFDINGARTVNDFLDQDHLWWSKLEESESGFVDMLSPDGYEWYTDQGALKSLGYVSAHLDVPQEGGVKELYDKVLKEHPLNSHEFVATYYTYVQQRYPLFSSRDVRNIQFAVNLRIMDFDIPEEWFGDNHDVFLGKNYQGKMDMILELRRANMKGLTFSEIRMQEINRYLDNMAKIADADFKRRVDEGVKQQRLSKAILAQVMKQ